jgi:hypothetical protein
MSALVDLMFAAIGSGGTLVVMRRRKKKRPKVREPDNVARCHNDKHDAACRKLCECHEFPRSHAHFNCHACGYQVIMRMFDDP